MKSLITFGLLLLCCSVMIPSKPVEHDFYVSTTDIEVVNDTVQISMKVFIDDLAAALKKVNNQTFALTKINEFESNNSAILLYINSKFRMSTEQGKKEVIWLGHEIDEDDVWIYGSAPIFNSKSLYITNKVLMDRFDKQQNMINLKRESGYQSEYCTQSNPSIKFSL